MQVVQKSVDILKPKLLGVWVTWLRPGPTVMHPDTMKDILKASHVSAPKSREYSFLIPWIGKFICKVYANLLFDLRCKSTVNSHGHVGTFSYTNHSIPG